MLNRHTAEDPRYADPEELLGGKCMTCKAVVQCCRADAVRQKGPVGVWADLLSVGCPECGARVFVMPAKDVQKLVR